MVVTVVMVVMLVYGDGRLDGDVGLSFFFFFFFFFFFCIERMLVCYCDVGNDGFSDCDDYGHVFDCYCSLCDS